MVIKCEGFQIVFPRHKISKMEAKLIPLVSEEELLMDSAPPPIPLGSDISSSVKGGDRRLTYWKMGV